MQSTLDLLADEGLSKLHGDALAAQTGSGKAGIYRRWADLIDVAVAAVDSCDLIPPAPDTGSLRQDLVALLASLSQPLGRDELAAAALLSQARFDPRIQRALNDAVVTPLADAVTMLVDQHTARGHIVPTSSTKLLQSLVQAQWWGRYLTRHPAATPSQVQQLVDQVLLPLTV